MKEIIVYTNDSCVYCKKMKSWLNENKYFYTEVPVQNVTDLELQKKIKGVPYTIIKTGSDEITIIGFNPEKIQELLKSLEEKS